MSGIGSGKGYIDYPVLAIAGVCIAVSWPFRKIVKAVRTIKKWAKVDE